MKKSQTQEVAWLEGQEKLLLALENLEYFVDDLAMYVDHIITGPEYKSIIEELRAVNRYIEDERELLEKPLEIKLCQFRDQLFSLLTEEQKAKYVECFNNFEDFRGYAMIVGGSSKLTQMYHALRPILDEVDTASPKQLETLASKKHKKKIDEPKWDIWGDLHQYHGDVDALNFRYWQTPAYSFDALAFLHNSVFEADEYFKHIVPKRDEWKKRIEESKADSSKSISRQEANEVVFYSGIGIPIFIDAIQKIIKGHAGKEERSLFKREEYLRHFLKVNHHMIENILLPSKTFPPTKSLYPSTPSYSVPHLVEIYFPLNQVKSPKVVYLGKNGRGEYIFRSASNLTIQLLEQLCAAAKDGRSISIKDAVSVLNRFSRKNTITEDVTRLKQWPRTMKNDYGLSFHKDELVITDEEIKLVTP